MIKLIIHNVPEEYFFLVMNWAAHWKLLSNKEQDEFFSTGLIAEDYERDGKIVTVGSLNRIYLCERDSDNSQSLSNKGGWDRQEHYVAREGFEEVVSKLNRSYVGFEHIAFSDFLGDMCGVRRAL